MLNTSLHLSHLALIISGLRRRFAALNTYYEAGWTDSWCHRRCEHIHRTLLAAARCGMEHGCGWYVFATEWGTSRELTAEENEIVDRFRFGHTFGHTNPTAISPTYSDNTTRPVIFS
jgi:hypothetical protein